MTTLWMAITLDRYELPIAVADTAEQLAALVGCTKNCIYSSVSHSKTKGHKSRYIKVMIEEDSEC